MRKRVNYRQMYYYMKRCRREELRRLDELSDRLIELYLDIVTWDRITPISGNSLRTDIMPALSDLREAYRETDRLAESKLYRERSAAAME